MTIEATGFKSKFPNVKGYAITACFTPNFGFQHQWWVYLLDAVDAAKPPEPAAFDNSGRNPEDTLLIFGDDRSYQFPEITLNSIEPGATRRERFRVLEFQYPHTPGVAQSIPAVLSNTSDKVLEVGALQRDYEYGLDTFPQHLLGFHARLAPNDAVVLRFAGLRNAHNSFVEKLLQVNNQMAANNARKMPSLTVKFAQGNINVTPRNLVRAFICELYGECLKWPLPTLSDYLRADANADMARLNPPAHQPEELLEHEIKREYRPASVGYTVEVLTLILQPGHYRDLVIR
jgi:hypothetical protein